MPDFLAFVCDMHIAPPSAGAERAQSDLDRPERRARRLRAALEEIRALGPSAVFFGGDNTNQPVDSAEYRDALLSFVRESRSRGSSSPATTTSAPLWDGTITIPSL